MKNVMMSCGYFHITLVNDVQPIVHSNDERAFIVARFQDALSPRLLLTNEPAHHQLASCIDLLAFSITKQSVHLIVFAIDPAIAATFCHTLLERLSAYQTEYGKKAIATHPSTQVRLRKLTGSDEALALTVAVHGRHDDWEYDRYSSIGFYLHDRRGDWMRLWRMTHLYDNNPTVYRELMELYVQEGSASTTSLTHPLVA